jgi:predicted nuclease of predicted toxin-antitoxin system
VALALRDAGHDVKAVADLLPGASDQTVLEFAALEARILITKDKDFGELVFRFHAQSLGVILLRFPPAVRASVPATVVRTVALLSSELSTSFTVLTPSGPRLARLIGE